MFDRDKNGKNRVKSVSEKSKAHHVGYFYTLDQDGGLVVDVNVALKHAYKNQLEGVRILKGMASKRGGDVAVDNGLSAYVVGDVGC